MAQKLIKINTDHYVVVDDDGTRTHSTIDIKGVLPLPLQEVKELIGEVDVMTKAVRDIEGTSWDEDAKPSFLSGYLRGYRQALEDNKEKKYTEDDLRNAYRWGTTVNHGTKEHFSSFIQSLQPKTEWEVEIVDDKLKLK